MGVACLVNSTSVLAPAVVREAIGYVYWTIPPSPYPERQEKPLSPCGVSFQACLNQCENSTTCKGGTWSQAHCSCSDVEFAQPGLGAVISMVDSLTIIAPGGVYKFAKYLQTST